MVQNLHLSITLFGLTRNILSVIYIAKPSQYVDFKTISRTFFPMFSILIFKRGNQTFVLVMACFRVSWLSVLFKYGLFAYPFIYSFDFPLSGSNDLIILPIFGYISWSRLCVSHKYSQARCQFPSCHSYSCWRILISRLYNHLSKYKNLIV